MVWGREGGGDFGGVEGGGEERWVRWVVVWERPGCGRGIVEGLPCIVRGEEK